MKEKVKNKKFHKEKIKKGKIKNFLIKKEEKKGLKIYQPFLNLFRLFWNF